MPEPTPTTPAGAPLSDALRKPLLRLLRPLVRLLIHSGITFPVLADLLRGLYVDVALRDVLIDPKTQTDSRVSLLTGVHRKELRRLRAEPVSIDDPPPAVTLGSQIIARWLAMEPVAEADGALRPPPLPRLRGAAGSPSFETLVEAVTRDMRPRAILDEWVSQGIVMLDGNDQVRLSTMAFIPPPGRDAQLFYFARNLHDHVAAAAANVTAAETAPFLDRSLHYDRLLPATADRLEALAREAAQRLLVDLNRTAGQLADQDGVPVGPTRRVNLGIYLYSEAEAPVAPKAEPES